MEGRAYQKCGLVSARRPVLLSRPLHVAVRLKKDRLAHFALQHLLNFGSQRLQRGYTRVSKTAGSQEDRLLS
jgi:hypothetical protein